MLTTRRFQAHTTFMKTSKNSEDSMDVADLKIFITNSTMARPKKIDASKTLTPNELMSSFLKNNEKDHYNFEEDHDYKISSGSLVVDYELGGGFGPGLHRFTGINEGGKTSEASRGHEKLP